MKCISIRQPWVWAIMTAGKRCENRDWSTKYRGPLLIHAAIGMTKAEYAEFQFFWEYHFPRRDLQSYPKLPPAAELKRGGIVGQCQLIDVIMHKDTVPVGVSPVKAESFVRPWFQGRYGLILADVKPVPFVPYRGALGLFDVPDRVIARAPTAA